MTDQVKFDIAKDEHGGKRRFRIRHANDPKPYLEYAQREREREETFRQNKKSEMRHLASIDYVTCMNIKSKYGIDVFNMGPNDGKALRYILQTEYPKLLTTNKKVFRKGAKGAKGQHFGPSSS